jgi:hypothetical protein
MNVVLPDDERFAEFLRAALKDVHTPIPSPPCEEIWAGIMAHRRGAPLAAEAPARSAGLGKPAFGTVAAVSTDTATVRATTPTTAASTSSLRRRYSIPMRWALPIAAAVLVLGVGVGWQVEHSRASKQSDVVAATPEPLPKELPTQVAAEQHFEEVNQLLATFAAVQNEGGASEANNALVEAEVAAWARDLLATTQLLLDSPLGLDPQRRKLLTDVEMVLVQIAQLAPNSLPDDREITERSIEKSQMMERLQHATPEHEGSKGGASGHRGEAPQGI